QRAGRMEQAAFQLATPEGRAIAAEKRADEAEASLKRLQTEMPAKTMMKQLGPRPARKTKLAAGSKLPIDFGETARRSCFFTLAALAHRHGLLHRTCPG